ncbi:phytoene desaturase family protein [Aquihabitans sp. McL0605]|uniref:phytoene desaturase family protein n=1 Tax=Aquihabitans sp. McL0605 TaxID=3415671 RepID=UPI003CE862FC
MGCWLPLPFNSNALVRGSAFVLHGVVIDPDAVVVGAGPNGLVAAITLAQAGQRVLVVEAADRPGGGTRSMELMRPGVTHDICSAIHPLGLGSPALRNLPLERHGLRWIHPDVPLVHALDRGRSASLHRSVAETAAGLGEDAAAYRRLFDPLMRSGLDLTDGLLAPLTVPPEHPVALARYGLVGVGSARGLAGRRFSSDAAQGLFGGLAAHSVLSLRAPATAGYGLMLGMLGHLVGWPMAEGGSQAIADALVSLLVSLGGTVECGRRIASLDELPPTRAVLLDLTPRQVLAIAGERVPARYRRALQRFRYGPGVCKVDWVLDAPIPWADPDCSRSATVHLGGALEEVVAAEGEVQKGRHPERPFVLLVQPTLFDRTRAPEGTHTAWAYCHVPHGSTLDVSGRIEAQVERFAPGFREVIADRHVMLPAAMEAHDANYVGGDIGGGVADLRQFIARPTFGLHPWRTPIDGVWLCSSSTPPGAGVHGMCGLLAANDVLAVRR